MDQNNKDISTNGSNTDTTSESILQGQTPTPPSGAPYMHPNKPIQEVPTGGHKTNKIIILVLTLLLIASVITVLLLI